MSKVFVAIFKESLEMKSRTNFIKLQSLYCAVILIEQFSLNIY